MLGALSALATPVPGCTRRPTQLIVVVETDLVAGTDYQCFGLLVSRLDASGALEPGSTRRFLEGLHPTFVELVEETT
jgi:hypothetical protein